MSRILALTAGVGFSLASLAQAQFINLTQYANGTDLTYFVKADIANNGKSDVVGVQTSANTGFESNVIVLLATSTGFAAPLSTAISGVDSPSGFVVGDFNGDGFADVAFFGTDHVTGQAAIAVMLGNGNGTFQAGKETVIGSAGSASPSPCTANLADFNGDGKLDVAYLSSAGITVLEGKGNGTFSAPVSSSIGSYQIACITSGDFNNDKKVDLAATSAGGWVITMLGDGNGSFAAPVLVGKGGPGPIVAGELNGDANLDLVTAGAGAAAGVNVWLGNGTGKFPTTHSYPAPTGFVINSTPLLRDFNGDGHPDIAWLARVSNLYTVVDILVNNGEGEFTSSHMYSGDGAGAAGLFADDVNGEGRLDLVLGNNSGGISVLDGNGNGTFKGNPLTPTLGLGMQEGLFNQDANADLFLWGEPSALLLGNGDGTFAVSTASACNYNFAVTVGNFGNGALDVAGPATDDNLDRIGVCLNNGSGDFTAGGEFDQGVQHRYAVAGNFGGGAAVDLAVSDENGFSILLNDGEASFANGIATAVSRTWPTFAVADFNGDGKADVAALTDSGVAVYIGNGDGTFKAPIDTALPTAGAYIGVADLNKDGKPDLVIAVGNSLTGISVLLGKGNGSFESPVTYSLEAGALGLPVFGDFNQDGNIDVAIPVTTTQDHFDAVEVFLGSATGKLSGPTVFRAGGTITSLATADFNNDGKTDIAVQLEIGVATMLNQ